ncbi:LysR family transcriptional regulator [Jiella sp. MQZ9-1]|uniref:LysR family transcriptional regulator n=1 Tax=Jiella flava TaxID=2816857 RepID=A0A939JU07_9HYPH|nr:LysR family transcriptional regulator [Jiella flava]MBO0664563.1 LysR family transcriptional regulator [Jiella flava]MCD2473180.1 LysR family transcriptional regulator [Jiella flava]
MDLDQLRTFVAIAKEGNLTRAAKLINLSQPAVSGQLKMLEEELSLVLFRRTARGMELTSAGQSILIEAERALSAAGGITLRAKVLKGNPIEVFRLGTISEPTILRLSQLLMRLSENYPNLKLNITQGISGEVLAGVKDGDLDGGYVIGPVTDNRVAAVPVSPIMLRIVAPVTLRENLEGTSLASLSRLPWISTPVNCSFHHIMKAMFSREEVHPHIVIEADYESTLSELVASGMGLTLLREDVALKAEARGDLIVWRHMAERSVLNFVYLKENAEVVSVRALIDVVRQIWGLNAQPFGDPLVV